MKKKKKKPQISFIREIKSLGKERDNGNSVRQLRIRRATNSHKEVDETCQK